MALITNITSMSFIRIHIESINYCILKEQVILLDMECTEFQELPVVWLISTCLTLIGLIELLVGLVHSKAELKARLIILKHTRWKHFKLQNSALLLEEIICLHFS